MSDEDCGATFALPVAEDAEVVPVTIDVTDDAMSAMEGATVSYTHLTLPTTPYV